MRIYCSAYLPLNILIDILTLGFARDVILHEAHGHPPSRTFNHSIGSEECHGRQASVYNDDQLLLEYHITF